MIAINPSEMDKELEERDGGEAVKGREDLQRWGDRMLSPDAVFQAINELKRSARAPYW